ncbi:MAG: hypothetical protein ABFD18_09940 [Syntrophomonas sp.]
MPERLDRNACSSTYRHGLERRHLYVVGDVWWRHIARKAFI